MKRRKWLKFAVPLFLLVLALTYLFLSGMRKSMVYYLTLAELEQRSTSVLGSAVRLAGRVKEGSVNRPSSGGPMTFTMTDGKRDVPVSFEGVIPDTFREGGEVLVEGKYEGRPVFTATQLVPQCPSKYEAALKKAEEER